MHIFENQTKFGMEVVVTPCWPETVKKKEFSNVQEVDVGRHLDKRLPQHHMQVAMFCPEALQIILSVFENNIVK